MFRKLGHWLICAFFANCEGTPRFDNVCFDADSGNCRGIERCPGSLNRTQVRFARAPSELRDRVAYRAVPSLVGSEWELGCGPRQASFRDIFSKGLSRPVPRRSCRKARKARTFTPDREHLRNPG